MIGHLEDWHLLDKVLADIHHFHTLLLVQFPNQILRR